MAGGIARIAGIITFYLFVISVFIAVDLGLAIYNGIYWRDIKDVFSKVEPIEDCNLSLLPTLTLVTWILCIIVPTIGPIIPAVWIILSTHPGECKRSKVQFINQAMANDTALNLVWARVLNENNINETDWSNTTWFDNWFYDRCNKPSLINFIFTSIAILTILIVATRAICKKFCRRRRSYEQF